MLVPYLSTDVSMVLQPYFYIVACFRLFTGIRSTAYYMQAVDAAIP